MPLDPTSLEQLLHEAEGAALDFKQAQYRFNGADARTKSELLKDILSFVNSWRRETAYILIGVKEHQSGRSEVVGVTEHLDEANLQQFVNSKTQRPVRMLYYAYRTEGTAIGVIEIPVQQRPIWIRKQYGKVKSNTVYLRRGSSTSIAAPDEIAKMGEARVRQGPLELVLEWADLEQHCSLPTPCIVRPLLFDPCLNKSVFQAPKLPFGGIYIREFVGPHRPSPEEAIDFAFWQALLCPLGMVLRNQSGVMGERVRFVGSVSKSDGIHVRDWIDRPKRPSSYPVIHNPYIPGTLDPCVQEHGKQYSVTVDFGSIRPREEIWTTSCLLVGSASSGTVKIEGELLADNLPDPIPCTLPIQFDVARRPMERGDVSW